LKHYSFVRPHYLFPSDEELIAYKVGSLKVEKIDAILNAIKKLIV